MPSDCFYLPKKGEGLTDMFCQRSVYSCKPYTDGFEYALKMREMNNNIEPFNPYSDSEFEKKAFNDGYRDGSMTTLFHGLQVGGHV